MTRCGVIWSQNSQGFYVGAQRYTHQGPTKTYPSHDIAHVLVGAVSTLQWLPVDPDMNIRIAEFNAVVCETLLNTVFSVVYTESVREEELVAVTLKHARWFVDEYYAPFPMSCRNACAQFFEGISAEALGRLSPIYFKRRWQEVANGETDRSYRINFSVEDNPSSDRDVNRCQTILSRHWKEFHQAIRSA